MQINKFFVCSLVTACVVLPACTSDNIEIPKSELYAREFVKQFGVVDPNHDWTAAQHSSVTVKTDAPTDIRIIADFNGKTYRFGNYKQVTGTQTLTFDLPIGATNVAIKVNGQKHYTTVGAIVDLTKSSRAVNMDEIEFTAKPADKYFYFDSRLLQAINTHLPEDQDNVSKVISNFSFVSKAYEPITIYPIYWWSNSCHTLGVYWLNEKDEFHWLEPQNDGGEYVKDDTFGGGNYADKDIHFSNKQMRAIYRIRSGKLQWCENPGEIDTENEYRPMYNNKEWGYNNSVSDLLSGNQMGNDGNGKFAKVPIGRFRAEGITFYFNKDNIKFGFYIKIGEPKMANYNQDGKSFEYMLPLSEEENGLTPYTSDPYHEDGRGAFYMTAFSQISRNQVFGTGLSVQTNSGYRFYPYYVGHGKEEILAQLKDQNITVLGSSEKTITNDAVITKANTDGWEWASYFQVTNPETKRTRTFFGFEDYTSKPDMNDVVFLLDTKVATIDPETGKPITDPEEPEEEPVFPWIVTCEDLGGTYDHDFNDIVFGVQHEAGSEYAYITALAAGGTLAARLYYNGIEIKGGSDENGDQYTVYSPSATKEFSEWHQWFGKSSSQIINAGDFTVGATVRIKVGNDFTMSGSPENPTITIDNSNRLGGFQIQVDQPEGTTTTIAAPVKDSNPGDNIPQMFVTTYNFEWPKERVPIYQTHRGDMSGETIGTETPTNTTGTTTTYNYYTNSFHAWVNNAEANKGFHTQAATEPENVVHHGWTGYKNTDDNTPVVTE